MNPASGVDVEDVLPSLLLTTEGALSRNLALGGFLSAAHYPEWAMGHIPPRPLIIADSTSSSSVCTVYLAIFLSYNLCLGFVTPNPLSTIEWSPDIVSKLKRLIHSAKLSGAGTKIVLSIGMRFMFPG